MTGVQQAVRHSNALKNKMIIQASVFYFKTS